MELTRQGGGRNIPGRRNSEGEVRGKEDRGDYERPEKG